MARVLFAASILPFLPAGCPQLSTCLHLISLNSFNLLFSLEKGRTQQGHAHTWKCRQMFDKLMLIKLCGITTGACSCASRVCVLGKQICDVTDRQVRRLFLPGLTARSPPSKSFRSSLFSPFSFLGAVFPEFFGAFVCPLMGSRGHID